MIYTEDRDTFIRTIFRPPHMARLFDRASEYTARLRAVDRETLLRVALDNFWEMRNRIKVSNDITRVWDLALRHSALSRSSWFVWSGTDLVWVRTKSTRLGRS